MYIKIHRTCMVSNEVSKYYDRNLDGRLKSILNIHSLKTILPS